MNKLEKLPHFSYFLSHSRKKTPFLKNSAAWGFNLKKGVWNEKYIGEKMGFFHFQYRLSFVCTLKMTKQKMDLFIGFIKSSPNKENKFHALKIFRNQKLLKNS